MKKLAVLFLAILCLTGCRSEIENADILKTAVISTADSSTAENTLKLLDTSTIATLSAEKINGRGDLSKYDVLYIDRSVAELDTFDAEVVMEYVNAGGSVFLDNAVCGMFTPEFIGAEMVVKNLTPPVDMYYYALQGNSLTKLQNTIKDFSQSTDFVSVTDYGVGIIPSTAQIIAEKDGAGIYTINRYGDGYVFFTNSALIDINDTANKLLRDYFAEFVSLNKYGYAIEKVYGSFGVPAASWSVTTDDIRCIANGDAVAFSELCKPYGQIASFNVAESPYIKNYSAESVTYALNNSGAFTSEEYESEYTSGKHIVSGNKWLIFDDDTENGIKRAYPCPVDFDNDGLTDLICGSADGMLYFATGNGMDENYEMSEMSAFTDLEGNRISVGAYSSPSMTDIDKDGIVEILTGNELGQIRCYKPIGGLILEDMGVILETALTDAMTATGDLNGDGIDDLAVGSRTGEMRIYYGDMATYGISYNEFTAVDSSHTWCAPCIGDIDGDGQNELYAGTGEGNIAGFNNDNVFMGYVEYVNFGKNSVPRIYDINGDGQNDFIVGSKEYGMAMPRQSKYFPYLEEMKMLDGLLWDGVPQNNISNSLAAQYGLPLVFTADLSDGTAVLSEKIQLCDNLSDDYGYSFVKGSQLEKMITAMDNTQVKAKWENDGLLLEAAVKDKDIDGYNEDYQSCVGVKVILADGVLPEEFSVDASVHYKKDNCIYASLDKKVRISKNGEHNEISITSVNIPAKISKSKEGATVAFLDGGMMSVTVDGMVKTSSDGWETTMQGGKTVFTKFGEAEKLKIER